MKRLAPAKINIFLKITGTRGRYHELRSRFVRIDSLYDTLSFEKKSRPSAGFELECDTPLPERNSVSEAYRLLKEEAPGIDSFFKEYGVRLQKRIPQGAGLGGGSSDAAAFLHLCNEVCSLNIPAKRLARIGEKIGADVPFFVYGYRSANVEGIGEDITPFEEEPPEVELFTPPLHCDTTLVYRTFRERLAERIDPIAGEEWLELPSARIMEEVDPLTANDLYAAALLAYGELERYAAPGRFFSGSGSTFFEKL
ncbi:4-diphosphocytidyl-2-C-methyl-D-erythritol kinase [Hydrogenimonas sp.]|nr:4-diphosphocytidyl-2-C-methyl-D-erythritol kinase [Hydrogenimonas sp.]